MTFVIVRAEALLSAAMVSSSANKKLHCFTTTLLKRQLEKRDEAPTGNVPRILAHLMSGTSGIKSVPSALLSCSS
jgi:hypothetical protein